MAETPDAAIELSDDDLDELVNAEVGEMGGDSGTEDTGTTRTAPASDDEDDEAEDAGDAGQAAADDEDPEELDPPAPAGEAPPAGAPAPGAPVPAPAPAAIPGEKPFQFKASGGVHTLSGASELPDGRVVIAAAALPDFKRILASERELARQVPSFRQQLAAAKEDTARAVTDATAEATAMSGYIADLLAMDPDARWEALQQLEQTIPSLQMDVRAKQLEEKERRLAERERGPQPTAEEATATIQATLTAELTPIYTAAQQDPAVKILSKVELDAVFRKWMGRPRDLMKQATQDYPAQGITKGEWIIDNTPLIEDLQFLAATKKAAMAAAPAAPSGAAARNAANNADLTVNRIPPAVRSGTVPDGPRRSKTGGKMSPRKFKKDFLAGKLDDPEE